MSTTAPRSSRLLDVLAPLGLLVLLGAYAWQASGRTLPGRFDYYLAAAVGLAAAHLVLRWDALVRAIGRRQMAYGTSSLVLTLAVLAIVVGVNWLADRHTKRWDLTKNERFSLSEASRKVIAGLKEDVKVLYFQRRDAMAGAADRMKLYQSASPRLKVEFVDPLSNPRRAQEYDARGPYPVLILERGGRRERLTNDSEQDFTNGLVKITRDQMKTVCFVEGEGERGLDDADDRGYTAVKSALTASHYQTQSVLLLREGKVPEACTVVVVAGAQKDFLPPAIDALRNFVKAGGKLFVLLEPAFKGDTDALNALLAEWRITVAKDVVIDLTPVGQLFGAGPLSPVAVEYPQHEITKDLRGVATVFPAARSVKAAAGEGSGTVQTLAETTEASWAETDLTLKEPVARDAADQPGPVSLGVVATMPVADAPAPAPGADAPPHREGRVVVIGDSDFATNAMLDVQGNKDLFLNTVAWLAQDADLISIRPRDPEDQRLFLNEQQQRNVALFTLLLLPGAIVVMGVASWWRRR